MKIKLWQLFLIFAKVGVCTFGGGYAMLPVLQSEIVDKRGWLSESELADSYALAQCQPGMIFVNTAVLIVRPRFGPLAAVVAGLAVVFPSLVIIIIVAALLYNYAHLDAVQHAFAGIRVAVAATVAHSAWRLIRAGVRDWLTGLLCAAAFVLLLLDLVGTIPLVIAAAILGLVLQTWSSRRKEARP